jgi:hypothetical protein
VNGASVLVPDLATPTGIVTIVSSVLVVPPQVLPAPLPEPIPETPPPGP